MESDMKVHESLDSFIRQTMGREPYVSFTSRPCEKPLQRIIEHQQAMNKCVENLKADIDIRDGLEVNAHVETHQADIEREPSETKGGGSLGLGLQAERNLQTIKNCVPQAVAAFAAAKNPGKQNPRMDHLTDLPGWPLLSPSKVQLQKCEKCSREFFSPFNHRRHTRTHRRISHVDKEDLTLKRRNVAAFWDKLNQDEAQQIVASSRKYDLEDLSGDVVVSHLLAFKKQNNSMTLPPAYVKAGQDLLNMLDNKQIVFPLFSEQILSILDEASEKTFLCSQGRLPKANLVSKIGLEEKNLVASLGFIVEQTLVKAWMADKDAEALRNQQELVKEEEAAQMKRERNVAKKKKKKEKSRQKGLKERKSGATQLAINEESESTDGENLSSEIVEEDNSPTASSASVNSSGLENPLLEHLEMEVNSQVQNADGRVQTAGGEGGHPTSKSVVPESVDEELAQQSECDLASHDEEGERCSNFPSSSQVNVEDQGGCGRALGQDQSAVVSRKRTPLRPFREPMRVDYQDHSYQRGGWVPDPRFQEGPQQNSYRALRKPLIGTPYTPNIELGSNPVPGFYRNKPASLRGTAPFPATQQWAKKAQTPASADNVNKDGHEDQSALEHDAFISKSNVKDSAIEYSVLAGDAIGTISGAEKEDFRTFEKKEPPPAVVPSIAKVVAGTGGSSSIPTASFNLNVNSEDWPPLSNSYAASYPKSSGMYSLTCYQCEVNSRPSTKLNFVEGVGHQVGLESEVEGPIVKAIPIVRGSICETTAEPVTAGFQKGIMIGSVSVPLGDHVHPSRSGLGSACRRISTPQPAHQSYTAVLAAPPIRCTRDPMASTAGRQKAHDGTNYSELRDSSNMQVMDSYGGPVHYRPSSIRSSPCITLNVRHVRGPTYPLGDRGERGILPKQPAWSCGPVRHLPQKVWRPVRSTGENADPNPGGGAGIESSPSSGIEKATAEPPGREGSIDAASSRVEGTQVRDVDISSVEEGPGFVTESRAQVGDRNCVLDGKREKEIAPQDFTNCDDSSVSLDSEHLQSLQENSEVGSVARLDCDNACQPLKSNTAELITNFRFHDKNDNTEKMDDKAHAETVPSYSAWIAEAVEFHLSRWQSGLKDPETVVSSCEEEHPELLTSKWIDFMDSLPSIAAKLSSWKEDARDPMLRTPDSSDQIGAKSSRNAHCSRQEGSAPGSRSVSSGEEPRDSSSACENVSPSGVGSTPVGSVSGSQNHGKGDSEGRIGSRCGSSCSDSSMTSNSRRDWTGTVNATRERPQEKRYMPKQGRPEEKRCC